MSGAEYSPERMFETGSDILAALRVSLEEGLGKAKPSMSLLHSRIAIHHRDKPTQNGKELFNYQGIFPTNCMKKLMISNLRKYS
jgi:hypothetical protein